MNQLLRNLIIVLVIISYSILAASSYSEQEIKAYIGITIGVIVLIGLIYAIVEFVKQKNQEKRNEIKREFENNLIDFSISDKIGDDRCTIYLDKYNNKLKVIAITTDGITEQDIDSVTGDLLFTQGNGRYVIDNVNKKIWAICSNSNDIIVKAFSFGVVGDKYATKPFTKGYKDTFVTIDTDNGYIVACTCNKGIHIIADKYKPSENEQSIFVNGISTTVPSDYVIVRDEAANMLFIVKTDQYIDTSIKSIKYEDVIKVEIIEDGNTISSRSTSRTIGGTIVGGAILGGAGAIVGGLSGNTKSSKKVSSITIKVLLRSAVDNSYIFELLKSTELNLSKTLEKQSYDSIMKTANEIKNILEVIIDKVDSASKSQSHNNIQSIADELEKLVMLKERGVLSEKEFIEEKRKLLNK